MSFLFSDEDRFSSRSEYKIQLIVEAEYESGGTRYTINNQAIKDIYRNDSPFSSGSPRSYSVPNGRAGSMTGPYFTSGSDSSWSFSFNSGSVPQSQDIWGSGSFTRWIQDSDNPSTVTVSASHSLLGSASASTIIKHIYRTSFDANGGSVTPSFTDARDGDSITLPNPSRSGYDFDGWLRNGSNVGGAGSSYTVTSTETLVASWSISTPAPVWSDGVANYGIVRVGQSFFDNLQASNTTSYSFVSGPSGLSVQDFGSYGRLVGTINPIASGTYSVTVRATGPGGSTNNFDSFEIRQALPSWTDDSLPNGTVGQSYSGSISANNTSYWSISESIPGISATDTSGTTATLTGTPTGFGSYTVSATPYNSDNDAGDTRNISVTIVDSAISWVDNTLSTTTVVEGQPYSDGVSATGSDNISYSVSSGSLPTGITLNTSTGAITGTPTVPGTYTFSIQASNGDGSSVITASNLSITVEVAGGFMKVWNGSAWVEAPAKVWNGSAWVEGTVKVWNGSAWVDSFSS